MNFQHKNLANGRWGGMSFPEQMANIGSEVSRALNWKKKGNQKFLLKAVYRALELTDLSLSTANSFSRFKELARMREAIVDYFLYSNHFSSSEILWRKYFDHFAYYLKNSKNNYVSP